MDMNSTIKRMIETGKVQFGSRSTAESLKNGKARLVIISQNCPKAQKADLNHYAKLAGTHVVIYDGTSMQLGELCGKPFVVSSLVVTDPGAVSIADIVSAGKPEQAETSESETE